MESQASVSGRRTCRTARLVTAVLRRLPVSRYRRRSLAQDIEAVLQSEASPKSFLFKHLWIRSFSGLADNEASGCSLDVVAFEGRWGRLATDSPGEMWGAASLFCGFFRWQLRPPTCAPCTPSFSRAAMRKFSEARPITASLAPTKPQATPCHTAGHTPPDGRSHLHLRCGNDSTQKAD